MSGVGGGGGEVGVGGGVVIVVVGGVVIMIVLGKCIWKNYVCEMCGKVFCDVYYLN